MNVALILSGGTGVRFGSDTPKQYLRIRNRMLISWTVKAVWDSGRLDAVQIVAAEAWRDAIREELPDSCVLMGFSSPGDTRQGSILNGLRDILAYAAPEDTVLIHDAARPFVSKELIDACYAALSGHDGVMPVLPMTDTVYYSESGSSAERVLPRSALFAGQAPELFRLGQYLSANHTLTQEQLRQINGTSEPAVLAGLDVVMIPGSRQNFKITTLEDWERCRELLNRAGQ